MVKSVILDIVDLEYLLPNISSLIPAILLVDIPLEYIDTIRSSIPIDLLYGSITCVWKLLSLSLGTFNCFISPYFVFKSLLYFPFFIPGLS